MLRRGLALVVVTVVALLPGVVAEAAPALPVPTADAGFETRFADIPATGDITLGAMVMEPREPGPHPVAVLISAWGGGRTQNILPARDLADRGYVVVAYGARGFGESGGEVQVAGADDITDVSTVIDWALANTRSDPARIGVSGVSYGAGIALIASGFDPRIKAVATSSGWTDLVESLNTNDTRHGFAGFILYESGKQNGRLSAETDAMLSAYIDPELSDEGSQRVIDWARPRSPVAYLDRINANQPAVLNIQTWSETVFPPGQMVDLFANLTGPKRAEFVPGDHAASEYPGLLGLPSTTWNSVYRWFDAYVAGTDRSITTEPPLVIRSRPGMQSFEGFTTWDQVVGTPTRMFLGRSGRPDGTLAPTQAPGWSTDIASTRDTVANGGVPLVTGTVEFFIGMPQTTLMFQIDRSVGSVYAGDPVPSATQIQGEMRAHLTVTPVAPTGTVVAYVYDVNPLGVGTLVNYVPFSWRTATPGQPMPVDLTFEPTAYSVSPGHRIQMVVDSMDPLFLDRNRTAGRTTLTSTAADPSWLDVPIRAVPTPNGAAE